MTAQGSRVRIERLAIVESRSPVTFVRDVPLQAGLNVVWAEELPSVKGTTEVERAGHGVGKTTFSLMLRAVLGDDGAAVKTMRSHLAEYYGSGGIAAEVVAGVERFGVFRAFGSQSFALRNATVESLLAERAQADALDFSAYVMALGERACLMHMGTRVLPVTGQAVEWAHVLCWIARDQALGLRRYFEWRNDDGTGLRRKSEDPPTLVRVVLGLVTDTEAKAEEIISSINAELSTARGMLRSEEQRRTNTRSIVETQLRQWAGVANDLQMIADDLFADSVEKEIQRKTRQLETKNDEDRAAVAALDRDLVELAAEIKMHDRTTALAKSRLDETVALRMKDQKALAEIGKRRDDLLTVEGMCQFGAIAYSDCSYVQAQRDTVQLAAKRDASVLSKAVGEHDDREATQKAEYETRARTLAAFGAARDENIARKARLTDDIERRLRQLGEGDSVRKTLSQWQESHGAPETERLRAARVVVVDLEKKLESGKAAKITARQQGSEREREVSARIARFADQFGANGRYVSSDKKRPFQMLGADGDAYTVLEILLGDLACAAAGVDGEGAHPGLLIFDCPREREMGPHLYDRFLTQLDDVCKMSPGLQVIVTTTTPPPGRLREPPTRILKLSRATDDDLLLKRRIENLLARATPSSRDDSEPER